MIDRRHFLFSFFFFFFVSEKLRFGILCESSVMHAEKTILINYLALFPLGINDNKTSEWARQAKRYFRTCTVQIHRFRFIPRMRKI